MMTDKATQEPIPPIAPQGLLPGDRREASTPWAWLVLTLAVGFLAFFRPIWDPDTFWHLAVGREIARTGGPVYRETFSFTAQGAEWEDTEWAFHALVYPIWKVGGENLLVLATALAGLLILGQLFRLLRMAGAGGIGACLVSLAVLPVLADRVRCRPDLLSMLLLGVLLEILWEAHPSLAGASPPFLEGRSSLLRLAAGLGLLFALWANFHGGWAYGLALLGAFLAGLALDRWRLGLLRLRDLLAMGGLLVASVLGLFLTPYTWRVPWFPVKSVLSFFDPTLIPIAEWNRTVATGYRGALLALGVLVLLGLFTRRAPWALSLPVALQLILAFLWVRYPPFALLVVAPSAVREGRVALAGLFRPGWARPVLAGTALGAALALGAWHAPQARARWDLSALYPATETRFLQENSVSGNLLNPYAAGGYLDWHYYPLGRTFMDGRFFPFTDALGDYFRSVSSVDAFHEFLDRRGVELAVHPHPDFVMAPVTPGEPPRGLFHHLYPRDRWAAVCYSNYGGLFLRRLPRWRDLIEREEYRAFEPDEVPFLRRALRRGEADGALLRREAERCLREAPRIPFEADIRRLIRDRPPAP